MCLLNSLFKHDIPEILDYYIYNNLDPVDDECFEHDGEIVKSIPLRDLCKTFLAHFTIASDYNPNNVAIAVEHTPM